MFKNFTSHTINVHNGDKELVATFESAGVARCSQENTQRGSIDGIELYDVQYGEVSGLPDPQDDTYYIVSFMVKNALPARSDLLSPGELLRDAQGRPIGCIGLQ